MRVLIISAEVWQDGTNGGNVLSNIFADAGFELAQVYCNPGTPQNTLCNRYYQMTDSMVIRGLLRNDPIGKAFDYDGDITDTPAAKPEQSSAGLYAFFRRYRLSIFYAMRSVAWNISRWRNERLRSFILGFDPNVIFAPCYGNTFMLKLTRYVAELTGKKVISYISDDSYTLRQFRLSPIYWLQRFSVRRELRKTFPYYSLVYTMTDLQKKQCERDFHANMKILLKSVSFKDVPIKREVSDPIRLVYAGGIYLNRWKTLASVAEAIRRINQNGIQMRLDIYTANEITPRIDAALNDGTACSTHAAVSQEELKEIYHNSDIALHVESFDLKNRLAVRMSFSTKIVDCLSSGCAVMAICDREQGGYQYLEQEKAAICVPNASMIYGKLKEILDEPAMILEYADMAKQCCERNHDRKIITEMVRADFEECGS